MIKEDLAQLSREELIQLILVQAEQLSQMKADYEALRLKLEKGKKPPSNSSNSSLPPSRDRKGNLPSDRYKRKHGPPVGHAKHERKFIANPDHVVEVKVESCPNCQANLRSEEGKLVAVNQITELPQALAQVIEVRQYEVVCPQCGRKHLAQPPEGLEMERTFGPRLEATVVYYHQEQHISRERTQKTLWNLYQATISQGGIDKIMQRVGQKAIRETDAIQAEVQQSAVVHSDETGSRVDGQNWWEWTFCTLKAVLHQIRSNRSVDVINGVMGSQQAEVWVSDCYNAQLKAPAKQRQICMAHQLRNLQAVIDRYPTAFWARAMQALFRYGIHLHHQRDQLPPANFQAEVIRLERLCDWLIERPLRQPEASRLQRRYKKYRQMLFVFLYRTDVDPTNNISERTLRPSVVHRKVSGGFRSGWGARAYAALASVIDTADLKGMSAFDAVQHLVGQPSLPLPVRV